MVSFSSDLLTHKSKRHTETMFEVKWQNEWPLALFTAASIEYSTRICDVFRERKLAAGISDAPNRLNFPAD